MSKKHLLSLSIGPVQEFIAAARRTSDLTAGSILLVEVAKAAARAVEHEGATLIFPADSQSDGPNKILAALPDGVDPKTVADAARNTAKKKLRVEWGKAKETIDPRYKLNAELADAQIEQFLEFYAAWVPYTDDTYALARKQVDALLAGRKNLRNFDPPRYPEKIAPVLGKSPLDPAFESVVTVPQQNDDEKDAGYLRLRKTEYLDAVSVLKRVKGRDETRKVPSTRDLARRNKIAGFHKGDWSDEDDQTEDYGYYAILVADGDKMGGLLGDIDNIKKHQHFSAELARFANEAGSTVKKHDGYLVYSGGDDVVALLPVKNAVACAQELADKFKKIMKDVVPMEIRKKKDEGGTLSAGIAVVHYRQPLSMSLEAAREAEKAAKDGRDSLSTAKNQTGQDDEKDEKAAKDGERDSLCLAIHTRGGQPLLITQKWIDWTGTKDAPDFTTWLEAFRNGSLTRGVAYELRQLADEFENVSVPPDLLCLEAKRIWERKQSESKVKRPDFPEAMATNVKTLKRFADLLIAARFLTAPTNDNKETK